MKRFISIAVCLAMIFSLMPISAFATDTWENGPVVQLVASALNEDGEISVTVTVGVAEDETSVFAYGFGVEYNPSLFEVDTTKGTYLVKDPDTGKKTKKIGLDAPEQRASMQYMNKAISTERAVFYIADATSEGFDAEPIQATFYFKVIEEKKTTGGKSQFVLAHGTATGPSGEVSLFEIANEDRQSIVYPETGNSASVSIPIQKVDVTGTITTPAKGALDETSLNSTNSNVDVNVAWSPALLDDNKFAADTEYRATITVSPKTGLAFAEDAQVSCDGLTFNIDDNGNYVATKTFEKTADKTLTNLEIITQPTKTTYVDGDTFDATGMVVKATYDDGSENEHFTGYSVSPTSLKKGDTNVIITADDKSVEQAITVNGKTDGFAGEFTLVKTEVTYTGEDLTSTFTSSITHTGVNGTVTYSVKKDNADIAEIKDVGNYKIYASVSDDSHYADTTEPVYVGTVTVNPKTVVPAIAAIADQTYNGSQITPNITVNCADTLVLDKDYTITYGENKNAGNAAGSVIIRPVSGSNYTFSEASMTFNIKPLTVELEWPEKTDYPYTGSEQSVRATITNLATGDNQPNLTYSEANATDVGEYCATVTNIDSENYSLADVTNNSFSWKISKVNYSGQLTDSVYVPTKGVVGKNYSISGLSLSTGFKDATITAASITMDADSLIDGNVEVTEDRQSIAFSTKQVDAENKTATITLTISSKNYNDVTAEIIVTAKDVTFDWDNAGITVNNSFDYGTKNSDAVTLPATASGKDANDKELAGTLTVASAETVQQTGTQIITLTFEVTAEGDYKGTKLTKDYTVTVNPKTVAVTWGNTELTYNGAAQSPTATATGVNGETLNLTVNGSGTDAGTYSASAELTSVTGGNGTPQNYSLTNTPVEFKIKPANTVGTVVIQTESPIVAGAELTANTASVTGSNFSYQWNCNGTPIRGATSDKYTATTADVGKSITVTVSSSGNYTGSVTSDSVVVEKTILTGTVTICGETELTATVTDSNATAENYEFVWMRNGTVIPGATGDKYTVVDDDKGCTITAKIVAKGDLFKGESPVSAGVDIPATAPSFSKAPEVTAGNGSATVTLDANPCGSPITQYVITVTDPDGNETVIEVDGTESGYTITGLTNGKEYKVKVTAVNAVGETTSEEVAVTPKSTIVYVPTYKVTVVPAENGTVTVNRAYAVKGATVTITVTPDDGHKLDTLTVTDASGNPITVTEKNGVYSFAMPNGSVRIVATFIKNEIHFVDVPENAYYAAAVKWAVDKGITNGTSANTFGPETDCTRAQAVTFLWRAAGSPEPTKTDCAFADVDKDSYYFKAVLWAIEQGITNGTSDTTFGPNDTVTRAQMVTFLYRFSKDTQVGTNNPFTDVAKDAYYNKAVLWAVEKEITNGTGNTTFSPNENCLRCQIVTFLYRYYN